MNIIRNIFQMLFSQKKDQKHIGDVKVSRLFSCLTRDQSIGFLDSWNQKRDRKQRIYISYDSTNKNCQAGDIDILEFVTLIVRNRMYSLLKEEMLRIETKPNSLTVPAAVRELEKIEMVRRNNGAYRLDHAVTKKQKDILAAFGLDADYVVRKSMEISQLLKRGMSMSDVSEEEDNDGKTENDYFD